ncbi:hypothetical protein EY643_15840 [Halioglobus maricola]|uniref:Uncharacterized protein n=1 Tax=Halioglobus maricola TaxID=2601894 RepID=A0A5P9NME8_9GAMM|nr:hypothetical protein [Halioglobus maricola]QFU77000.1 hypothetical protein EY643_15840 [Halioglobus maricola]
MTIKTILLTAAICCTTSTLTFAQSGNVSDYECQVTTTSGVRGLIMLTAASAKVAEERAVGLNAYTGRGIPDEAAEVVECINRTNEEKFSDYRFEWWSMNEVDR